MKFYFKICFWSLPLALGIVLSLVSIAFTVKVVDGNAADEIISAIVFGVIGYPLLVASTMLLTKQIKGD